MFFEYGFRIEFLLNAFAHHRNEIVVSIFQIIQNDIVKKKVKHEQFFFKIRATKLQTKNDIQAIENNAFSKHKI